MIRRLRHADVSEVAARRPVSGGREVAVVDSHEAEDLGVDAYRLAYAEGFKAGEQDGRREAAQFQKTWERETRQHLEDEILSVATEKENLTRLHDGLVEAMHNQVESMQTLAFEIALASMARAFGAMQDDGELLRRLCAQVTEEYRAKAIRLVVSQADRTRLPDRLEGLDVGVVSDLNPGECRIEMARGQAESSVATRIETIYDAMLETLGIEPR